MKDYKIGERIKRSEFDEISQQLLNLKSLPGDDLMIVIDHGLIRVLPYMEGFVETPEVCWGCYGCDGPKPRTYCVHRPLNPKGRHLLNLPEVRR